MSHFSAIKKFVPKSICGMPQGTDAGVVLPIECVRKWSQTPACYSVGLKPLSKNILLGSCVLLVTSGGTKVHLDGTWEHFGMDEEICA